MERKPRIRGLNPPQPQRKAESQTMSDKGNDSASEVSNDSADEGATGKDTGNVSDSDESVAASLFGHDDADDADDSDDTGDVAKTDFVGDSIFSLDSLSSSTTGVFVLDIDFSITFVT